MGTFSLSDRAFEKSFQFAKLMEELNRKNVDAQY